MAKKQLGEPRAKCVWQKLTDADLVPDEMKGISLDLRLGHTFGIRNSYWGHEGYVDDTFTDFPGFKVPNLVGVITRYSPQRERKDFYGAYLISSFYFFRDRDCGAFYEHDKGFWRSKNVILADISPTAAADYIQMNKKQLEFFKKRLGRFQLYNFDEELCLLEFPKLEVKK